MEEVHQGVHDVLGVDELSNPFLSHVNASSYPPSCIDQKKVTPQSSDTQKRLNSLQLKSTN